MKRWILCICAVAVLSQQNAQAQWETKGFIGVNSAPSINFRLEGSQSRVPFWKSEVDLGPIAGLTVGCPINPRFSIEGELAYRYNHGTFARNWDDFGGS